jgi:hypothetical protein
MPIFDKNTARIKMVALTKNGFDNITWYSLEKFNKGNFSDEKIMNGMLGRIKDKPVINHVQKIQFYDNQTKKLIKEIDG